MSSRVALVTGGSKGVGQGIAVGLAESGWTVFVSGRNEARLAETVRRVEEAGGRGVAVPCEHSDDTDVRRLVQTVAADGGALDLLVNNAWAGSRMNHERPERFWERPLSDWDQLVGIGLRAHFVAAHAAAPLMVEQGSGLIVNISSVGARAYLHSTLYGISKAALDKMTYDMALELRQHGVGVIGLWPGLVRTAQLLASGVEEIAGVKVRDAESPELQGRVVAALAAQPDVLDHTGRTFITAEVARDLDIAEPHGGFPVSPREMFGCGPVFSAVPSGAVPR